MSRTEPLPATESKAKEEMTWLSRTNSRRGEKPESGGETVRTDEFGFSCSIARRARRRQTGVDDESSEVDDEQKVRCTTWTGPSLH